MMTIANRVFLLLNGIALFIGFSAIPTLAETIGNTSEETIVTTVASSDIEPLEITASDLNLRSPTDLPASSSPSQTLAPIVQEPVTREFVSQVSVPQDSVFQEPASQNAVFQESEIQEPVTQEPVTQESEIQEPVTQESEIQESEIQESEIQEPIAQESVIYESVPQESVTQESVTQESVTQESVTQESVTQESVTQESEIQEPVAQDAVTPETVTPEAENSEPIAQLDDISPGRATRSSPSYIGVGGNIGLGEGDTALGESSFAVFSKIGLTNYLSARPSILISDDPTILLPLTFDFIPGVTDVTEDVSEEIDLRVSPYIGVGAAISTSDEGAVDFLATGGVDIPINSRFTANAAVNATLFNNAAVGLMLGIGYNF